MSLASLVLRKIQIKTTMCYHYTCMQIAEKQQQQQPDHSKWQGIGQQKFSFIACANAKWCSYLQNILRNYFEVEHVFITWLSNYTSKSLLKSRENRFTQNHAYSGLIIITRNWKLKIDLYIWKGKLWITGPMEYYPKIKGTNYLFI